MHGVIEGFYGPPWSHAARLRLLAGLGRRGLSRYVYAPKGDPKHRSQWAERYDDAEQEAFTELFAAADDAGVRATFGLAPTKLLARGPSPDPAARQALVAKLLDAQAAGARSFMLLFDDVPATFATAAASSALGRAQGELVATLADEVRQLDPDAEVLVTPSVYFRTWDKLGRGQAYWRGLAATVPPGTEVGWTGPSVFSPWIASADLRRIEDETDLRLFVWNNAIANDWLPMASGSGVGLAGYRKLSFGPPTNVDPGLRERTVLLNGALEAEPTALAAAALASWAGGGEAAAGWLDAAAERVGDHAPALLRFHDLVARNLALDRTAPEARVLRGALADPGAVEEALVAIRDDAAALAAVGDPLVNELAPSLRKARLMAEAGLASLRPDPAARRRRDQLLAEARGIRWLVARGAWDPLFSRGGLG